MASLAGNSTDARRLDTTQWLVLGALAAVTSVLAVLVVRALALTIWPDLSAFDPLGSVPRAILFTAVPAFAATGIFAWLAARRADPVAALLKIAAVVLVLSFIPDYVLPIPDKSLLGSTVAAFLHIIAAIPTVAVLVLGYRRQTAAQ